MHLHQALFANEAFYVAFNSKDLEAMQSVWASGPELVCIHPGWPALVGRQVVLDSWASLLANPEQGEISVYGASTTLIAPAGAANPALAPTVLVTCYEQVAGSVMIASNLFIEEAGTAKLVLHQAGPCANPPAPVAKPQTSH